MGVIRPPWVTKSWFTKCPFNYCDHFGDKLVLATLCRICNDEVQRLKLYKKAGKDPNDMKEVMKDIGDSLTHAMYLLHKDAERMGIDLNNLDDIDIEESPEPSTYPLFQDTFSYGKALDSLIKKLSNTPILASNENLFLLEKVIEVLSHARFYMLAKIGRAYSSKWEEDKDPDDDLDDAKTSAFLAYIAIKRNEYALKKLIQEGVMRPSDVRLAVQLRRTSEEIAEWIQQEFFPKDKLIYQEFGCNSYNKLFEIPSQSARVRKNLSTISGKLSS